MKRVLPFAFLFGLSFSAGSQILQSSQLLNSWSFAQMSGENVIGAVYGVKMYKLVYKTIDVQGDSTIASGALFLPNTTLDCDWPLAVYMHGTVYLKNDVPSFNSGEALVGKYMAAYGFVGILPDYLGLGDSPGLHPYLHADTEASSTIDMIRASKEFCNANAVSLNEQLFLTGYSQGGHTCLATLREMEQNLTEEFQVTACAGGSGPYDLSGVQAESVAQSNPYDSPEYLPYIIFSYQSVYGNLYNEPSDFLVAPYDQTLPPLFNGLVSGGTIQSNMPSIPNEIIVPSELEAFNTDPNHPMRMALQANDLLDWAPQVPTRLYYCTGDGQVFHENSLVAHDAYVANGSDSIELMNMGTGDHSECGPLMLFNVLAWFGSLKEDCATPVSENASILTVVAFPNPANEFISIQFSHADNWNARLSDLSGRVIMSDFVFGFQMRFPLRDLSPGIYLLTIDEMPGSVLKVNVQH